MWSTQSHLFPCPRRLLTLGFPARRAYRRLPSMYATADAASLPQPPAQRRGPRPTRRTDYYPPRSAETTRASTQPSGADTSILQALHAPCSYLFTVRVQLLTITGPPATRSNPVYSTPISVYHASPRSG